VLPVPQATCRAAVRAAVGDGVGDGVGNFRTVLVGCSGGADSWALLRSTLAVAHGRGFRVGVVIVDHGLQPGAGQRAHAVAHRAVDLGADPVEVVAVPVGSAGGPEAAARAARLAALRAAADRHHAPVLLAHTADDQAETVLLGLARGAGARSLAGMPAVREPFRRPFLTLRRTLVHAVLQLDDAPHVWQDPHNADPTFARARVRHTVLPMLERELGPGVADALARTARLLADDAEALDGWAEHVLDAAATDPDGTSRVGVDVLLAQPAAVRSRVLKRLAHRAGAPGSDLTVGHVRAMDALVTRWHGQGPLHLPGRVQAGRAGGDVWVRGPGAGGVRWA
jgi:tRNA(Ile)-lysidine synthase